MNFDPLNVGKILSDDAIVQADRLQIPKEGSKPEQDSARDAFRHACTAAKLVVVSRKAKVHAERFSDSRYGFPSPSGLNFSGSDQDSILASEAIKFLVKSGGYGVEARRFFNDSSAMDVHNNAVGADIGADLRLDTDDDMIGDAVYAAMQRGDMILSPGDWREDAYDVSGLFERALSRAGLATINR